MKILLSGPVSGAVTGQSKVFRMVMDCFNDSKVLDFGCGLSTLVLFFKIPVTLFFYRPDVLYFTTSRTLGGFLRDLYIVFWARALGGVRLVNHLHGSDFLGFRNRMPSLVRWIIDKVYSNIDCSIVLSEKMALQYQMYADMKIEVVPNFYDPREVLVDGSRFKEKPSACLNVLYLSNLMCSKGILDLIDACDLYASTGRKVHLRIAGSPVGDHLMSAHEIKNKVGSRLSQFITYEGVVLGEKKAELLNWAHVLCLPTYYPTEAQPISLIEGLAAGCYIVSTRRGYIESIYDSCSGCFVSEKSPESILSAFIGFVEMEDDLSEISLNNIRIAAEKFSLCEFRKSIKEVILRVA